MNFGYYIVLFFLFPFLHFLNEIVYSSKETVTYEKK